MVRNRRSNKSSSSSRHGRTPPTTTGHATGGLISLPSYISIYTYNNRPTKASLFTRTKEGSGELPTHYSLQEKKQNIIKVTNKNKNCIAASLCICQANSMLLVRRRRHLCGFTFIPLMLVSAETLLPMVLFSTRSDSRPMSKPGSRPTLKTMPAAWFRHGVVTGSSRSFHRPVPEKKCFTAAWNSVASSLKWTPLSIRV